MSAFVEGRELGRLITVSSDGEPHVGLYPFLFDGARIELHLNRKDEQLADLVASSRCAFVVDEPLAVVPSYWLHAEIATFATAYYRTVLFACEASVSTEADVLVDQQTRLMARYQREGGFRPLAAADPLYRGALGMIAALRLEVRSRKLKWKLGQNRRPEQRLEVARHLRERGRPLDAHAADLVEATLGRGAR